MRHDPARDPGPDLRVGTAMRKSMIELGEKSRFLCRRDRAPIIPVERAAKPSKKRAAKAKKPIAKLVKEYTAALNKLDDIEAELQEWLIGSGQASQAAAAPYAIVRPPVQVPQELLPK